MTQLATQPQLCPKAAMLDRVFAVLNDAKIPYVVLHGYEAYPHTVASDVDCLMPARVLPRILARVLHEHRAAIDGEVVNWLAGAGHFITLAGRDSAGSTFFLQFHVVTEIEVARRPVLSGREVLQGRLQRDGYWIPKARHEFVEQLTRRIDKGRVSDDHARHLSDRYRQDTDGCRQAIISLFGAESAARIQTAADSGAWANLDLPALRQELLARALRKHPVRVLWNYVAGAARISIRRLKADRGLNVVVLGPDGSGKSTAVAAIRQDLGGAFCATERRTFPPALRQRAAGESSATPHAVAPRSWLSSIIRAVAYWLMYCTVGYPFSVGRALANATLVVHDRHLLDCLVDPRRYRYGGPMGLLRLICRCIVKPDMVILLDVPAEVIQARKSEVPLEETRRQCQTYRQVVRSLPRSHIVNGDRPLEDVTAEVNDLILRHLADRCRRKFGLPADAEGMR